MSRNPLPAHSLVEAFLYLMATPCPGCGRGLLEGDDAVPVTRDDPVELLIPVCCSECGHRREYSFTVPGDLSQLEAQQKLSHLVRVNPTDSRSEIIDVARWILLFRMIAEGASKETDKVEVRRLGYEAAQCLEEALKFYEEDNDLPPDDAFFDESSRALCREHPHEFSRERLIGLRAKLPSLEAMEACQAGERKARKQRWWTPWR